MLVQTLQRKTSWFALWFTLERREWLCAVAVGILLGFGLGNGHTTQSAILNISNQLGQQKKIVVTVAKVAGCQQVRAQIATREAVKSEQGQDINLHAIPNCPGLPKK